MPTRTPEEFAALLNRCAHAAEEMGERLTDTYRVADLIRERDAEVAAAAKAEARAEVDLIALTLSSATTLGGADARHIAEVAAGLVGLTEETRTLDDGYAGWSGDERGGHAIFRPATRQRRLVGPWESIERGD